MIPIQCSSTYLPGPFPPATQKNYSVLGALSLLQLLLRFFTGLSFKSLWIFHTSELLKYRMSPWKS